MKKVELPDFDDMIKLASEIGQKKMNIMLLESKLELILAMITETVTKDEKYWVGGKPPSNAHIKDTYHILGVFPDDSKEIVSIKEQLAALTGDLKSDELLFKIDEEMIAVWRTQSANERGAYLDT